MRVSPPVSLSAREWAKLSGWARGRSVPVRRAERARIVLLAGEGRTNKEIGRILHLSPVTVRRWRARFALLGLAGIVEDAPRSGHRETSASPKLATILEETRSGRPTNGVRWTTRTLARFLGVSHTTIARAWRMSGVHPPQHRRWRLAPDPRTLDRSVDVAGIYVDPPASVLALSIDPHEGTAVSESSASRRAGSSRRRTGGAGRLTSARVERLAETVGVLDALAPSTASWRLTSRELLLFLESVNDRSSRSSEIHLLIEKSSIPQDPRILRWIDRHPRFHVVSPQGDEPMSRMVLEWFGAFRSAPRPSAGLPSLPGLERSLGTFLPGATLFGRPFAWTRSGAVSHWRSSSRDTLSSSSRETRDISPSPRFPSQ